MRIEQVYADLLKSPLIVSEARAELLKGLEQATGQTFSGDLWSFVDGRKSHASVTRRISSWQPCYGDVGPLHRYINALHRYLDPSYAAHLPSYQDVSPS